MVRPFDFDGFCRRLYRQGQSNQVFSRLHPESVVQEWTEVEGAKARWQELEPHYERLMRTGRQLDRLMRLRAEAGLPSEALDVDLLHAAYWTAFRASKVKGIADKAAELEEHAQR